MSSAPIRTLPRSAARWRFSTILRPFHSRLTTSRRRTSPGGGPNVRSQDAPGLQSGPLGGINRPELQFPLASAVNMRHGMRGPHGMTVVVGTGGPRYPPAGQGEGLVVIRGHSPMRNSPLRSTPQRVRFALRESPGRGEPGRAERRDVAPPNLRRRSEGEGDFDFWPSPSLLHQIRGSPSHSSASSSPGPSHRPLCVICRDARATALLIPCQHAAVCYDNCLRELQMRNLPCPLCREPVQGAKKGPWPATFFS